MEALDSLLVVFAVDVLTGPRALEEGKDMTCEVHGLGGVA